MLERTENVPETQQDLVITGVNCRPLQKEIIILISETGIYSYACLMENEINFFFKDLICNDIFPLFFLLNI